MNSKFFFRNWYSLIIPSFLNLLIIIFQSYYSQEPSTLKAIFIGSVIYFSYYTIEYLNKIYIEFNVVEKLRRIINISNRDPKLFSTIKQFLLDSEEEKLKNGDELFILTNSIKKYDASEAAIEVISANIEEGVKYHYFIFKSDYVEFDTEKKMFITKVQKYKDIQIDVIKQNLLFYEILDPGIYNFAIVKRDGGYIGYYYQMIPTKNLKTSFVVIDKKVSDFLFITTLNSDNTTFLLKVFLFLKKYAKKIKAYD